MIKSFARNIFLSAPLLIAPCAHSETDIQRGIAAFSDRYQVSVEIADTEAKRQYGLMHRPFLEKNAGMLFVYPDQALRAVWMKNTLIPLDILFLSASGQVISMLPNLSPCRSDPCPVYTSKFDARYMLEVNAGFIAEHGINVGQEVKLGYAD